MDNMLKVGHGLSVLTGTLIPHAFLRLPHQSFDITGYPAAGCTIQSLQLHLQLISHANAVRRQPEHLSHYHAS
jgi:hypothetical protein